MAILIEPPQFEFTLTSNVFWLVGYLFDFALIGVFLKGYMLADRGYDVWMGNARGNTYSRQHVNISTADDQYWNFTY